MAATALIKFTQGVSTASGLALAGEAGTLVTVENVDNTDVQSWRIEMLYVPTAPVQSTFTPFPVPGNPTLVAENSSTSIPSGVFTPDVPGCYRVRLIVYSGSNFSGSYDIDIRNFAVPLGQRGLILPPYQRLPDPLPLQSKPDELNFTAISFGWTGGTSPPLANQGLYWAAANICPTATSDALPTADEVGQMVYATDIGQPFWWTGAEWADASVNPVAYINRRADVTYHHDIVLPLNEQSAPFANVGTKSGEGTWTASGSPVAYQSAWFDRGVNFPTGSNAHVLVGPVSANLQGCTAISVSAWVLATEAPTIEGVVVYKSGLGWPQRTVSLSINSSLIPIAYVEGHGTVSGTAAVSAVPLNRWTYLAMVYSETTIRLFRDGVEVANMTYGGGLNWGPGATEQNAPWLVGNNDEAGGANARPFIGTVEDVRVITRDLTPAEVMDNYLLSYGLRRERATPVFGDRIDTVVEAMLRYKSTVVTVGTGTAYIEIFGTTNQVTVGWDGYDIETGDVDLTRHIEVGETARCRMKILLFDDGASAEWTEQLLVQIRRTATTTYVVMREDENTANSLGTGITGALGITGVNFGLSESSGVLILEIQQEGITNRNVQTFVQFEESSPIDAPV